MEIPTKITFPWLWRTLPTLDADEFIALVAELEKKGWLQANAYKFGSNFYGMLYYGLRPAVRKEVTARGH